MRLTIAPHLFIDGDYLNVYMTCPKGVKSLTDVLHTKYGDIYKYSFLNKRRVSTLHFMVRLNIKEFESFDEVITTAWDIRRLLVEYVQLSKTMEL